MNQSSAAPISIQNDITYTFSRKPVDLQEYAKLVLEYYKKDLKLDLSRFQMSEDLHKINFNEHVLIIKDGDRIIGGSKLIFTHKNSPLRLPLESDQFRVEDFLPNNFGSHSYCELARLVLHPDYRSKELLTEVVDRLTNFAVQRRCGMFVLMAPPLNAILYRRICKTLDLPMQIRNDIQVTQKAAYQQLGLNLITCDLRQRLEVNRYQKIAV
ncbi:MAG: GNAT family N-acetyltransferase [Gammaproteobacteria bacterium]|nr:GNAT family N-acetyltransferase [Gammaproteobacteria bacterium]